jgi:ABC-type transporter Mla subunit MlaD
MEDLKQYRAMHEELRREVRSPSASLFKKTDTFDLQNLLKKLESVEDDKGLSRQEPLILKESRRAVESTHSELVKRLEQAESQSAKLKQLLAESEEESVSREGMIEQAQGIIKRLNSELEEMTRELSQAEKLVEQYRRENRQLDKTNHDIQRQLNEFEALKKTEERLRKEAASLKAEMQAFANKKEREISDITSIAEQASEDRRMLEEGIEMLEAKLEEIERQNAAREELLTLEVKKGQDLVEQLAYRQEELVRLREDYEVRETQRDEEFTTLKRHAENVMRQFAPSEEVYFVNKPAKESSHMHSFSNVKKCRAQKKAPVEDKENVERGVKGPDQEATTSERGAKAAEGEEDSSLILQHLQLQLEESEARELQLRLSLKQLIESEGKFIGDRLETLNALEAAERPEVERWIMRSEEMEGTLEQLSEANSELVKLVVDLQKTISIKNKQMQDGQQLADTLRNELTVALEFVRTEAIESHETVMRQLLPQSSRLLQDYSADLAKARSHSAREASRLCKHIEQIEQHLADMTERHQAVKGELIAAREDLARTDLDFKQIQHALDLGEASERTPTFTGDELEHAVQISQPAMEIIEGVKALKQLLTAIRTECYDKLNEIEREKPLNSRGRRLIEGDRLTDKELEWIREKHQMIDHIRHIKEIAQSDSEAKNLLQRRLEEEITQLRGHLAETQRKLLQSTAFQERTTMDDSVDTIQRSSFTLRKSRPHELDETYISEARDASPPTRQSHHRLKGDRRGLREAAKGQSEARPQQRPASGLTSPMQSFMHKRSSSESGRVFAFPRRTADLNTSEQMTKYYEKELEAKNSQIAMLEGQVGSLLQSSDITHRSTILSSLRSSVTQDHRASRDEESLQLRLDKLKGKSERDKKRHERRVQEFELILRFLEEKITAASTQRSVSPKVVRGLEELVRKNPNLKAWIDDLTSKLDAICPRQASREKRTYCEILSLMMDNCEVYANLEHLSALYKDLSSDTPDMDSIANKAVDWLYKAFRESRRASIVV